MAFLYMVECKDGSYYTGIAANIGHRMREHMEHGPNAAKYTRSHPLCRMVALWRTDSLAHAAKGEYAVKKLSRSKKELLVAAPQDLPIFCPTLCEIFFVPLSEPTLERCIAGDFDKVEQK